LKERADGEEFDLEHCGTNLMKADGLTKPKLNDEFAESRTQVGVLVCMSAASTESDKEPETKPAERYKPQEGLLK